MSMDAPEWGLGATQMHDAAIEAGLVARPERVVTDDEYNLAYREELQAQADIIKADRSVKELEQEEEDGDDGDELIAQLRAKRIEEIKAERARRAAAAAHTDLPEVDPSEFDAAVLAPSRHGWVLLCVYRPQHSESALLQSVLRAFAARHPQVTCAQMRASPAIKGLPPQDCPVLLVYRQSRVVKQYARLEGLAGRETTLEVVEWELAEQGVIEHQDGGTREDPRVAIEQARRNKARADTRRDSDDSDDD